MKEITYNSLEDYLEKSKAFEDPKVIHIYFISGNRGLCQAVTFMRTWLFKWVGTGSESVIQSLEENGHKKGKIQDVVPLGRSI